MCTLTWTQNIPHPDFATFINAQKTIWNPRWPWRFTNPKIIHCEDVGRLAFHYKTRCHKFEDRGPFSFLDFKIVKWLENFQVLKIHLEYIIYILSHDYEHYFIALILSELPRCPLPVCGSNLKRWCVYKFCPSSMDGHGSLYLSMLLYHSMSPYVHMLKKNNMLMVPRQMAPRCNLKIFKNKEVYTRTFIWEF